MILPTLPLPVVGSLTSADIGTTVQAYSLALTNLGTNTLSTLVFTNITATFASLATQGALTIPGAVFFTSLPTGGDPGVAGQLWNNSGVVMISAG